MSNIAKAFADGKAFIPFITCGDPDLKTTAAAIHAPSPTLPPRARSFRVQISAPCRQALPRIRSLTLCGRCAEM